MLPLMPFLDALKPDGSVDADRLLRIDPVRNAKVSAEGIGQFCRKAATIFQRHFALGEAQLEKRYFTLPKYTDVTAREFGKSDFTAHVRNPLREEHFCEIMDVLDDASGPQSPSDMARVKALIKADPELLLMVSSVDELATILHHAAAGPARDPAFVEWLIQMGALYWQPSGHFRNAPSRRDPAAAIDKLALHSAVEVGHTEAVLLLLEADNMRDLNTRTYRFKESMAHLAVKHGHRMVYDVLVVLGADIRGRSADGKRVSDLTQDREWKRDIVSTIVSLEYRYQACESGFHTGHTVSYQPLHLGASEIVPPLQTEPAVEEAIDIEDSVEAASGTKKKKKNKKKNKKTKSDAEENAPVTVGGQELCVEDGPVDTESVIEALRGLSLKSSTIDIKAVKQSSIALSALLKTAKESGSMPSPAAAQAATNAVDIVRHLQAFIETIRQPGDLKSVTQDVRLAVASSAFAAI